MAKATASRPGGVPPARVGAVPPDAAGGPGPCVRAHPGAHRAARRPPRAVGGDGRGPDRERAGPHAQPHPDAGLHPRHDRPSGRADGRDDPRAGRPHDRGDGGVPHPRHRPSPRGGEPDRAPGRVRRDELPGRPICPRPPRAQRRHGLGAGGGHGGGRSDHPGEHCGRPRQPAVRPPAAAHHPGGRRAAGRPARRLRTGGPAGASRDGARAHPGEPRATEGPGRLHPAPLPAHRPHRDDERRAGGRRTVRGQQPGRRPGRVVPQPAPPPQGRLPSCRHEGRDASGSSGDRVCGGGG